MRAAVDVMGVLDAVRRRRGHGVQVDRDGAGRLNRRTTHRTRGIGMVREVHEDAVAGEGDREQLVERPVQIGREEMTLGAGNRALITAFSHRGSFPTPAGAAGSHTWGCARVQLGCEGEPCPSGECPATSGWRASKASSSARTSTRAGIRIRLSFRLAALPALLSHQLLLGLLRYQRAWHHTPRTRAEPPRVRRHGAPAHQRIRSVRISRELDEVSSDELPVVGSEGPDRHPGHADEGRQQRAREHYPCGIDVAVQAFLTVNGLVVDTVVGPRRRLRPGGFAGGRVAQLGA